MIVDLRYIESQGLEIIADAKITELDLKVRKVKLSVKAAQIDEEKSLIAKFGEGATKSGATLKTCGGAPFSGRRFCGVRQMPWS